MGGTRVPAGPPGAAAGGRERPGAAGQTTKPRDHRARGFAHFA